MDGETLSGTIMVTDVVFHPLDTILTLQQTSTNFSYRLPFAHYWRGLSAQIVLSAPAFALYMTTYRYSKKELAPLVGESSLVNYGISAVVSELAGNVLWTPMEVIKGRMQISNQGLLKQIRDIYTDKKDGQWKGFFRGYWTALFVYMPYSVIWWTSYEKAKEHLRARKPEGQSKPLTSIEYGISSAIGAATACTSTNFLQLIRTRQQLATASEITKIRPDDHQSVFRVGRNLIQEVGLFGAFVKGLHVRLAVTVPSAVLSMVILEYFSPD